MIPEKILRFKTDTKHRKEWFTGMSFSHPAKMSLPLQLWIIENYTKAGETILDPMAGSGTILVACSLGRNVVAVELEQKFIDIMNGNWQKIKQRGPQLGSKMGDCQIIQGDARQLEGLFDKIITSPPFAGNKGGLRSAESFTYGDDPVGKRMMGGIKGGTGSHPDNIDNLPYGQIDKIVTSPPHGDSLERWGGISGKEVEKRLPQPYTANKNNIGNLPYGNVDSIITSPPYADQPTQSRTDAGILAHKEDCKCNFCSKNCGNRGMSQGYRKVDSIITSPPYSNRMDGGNRGDDAGMRPYTDEPRDTWFTQRDQRNIGNLREQSYLEAMLQVYRQCYKVLKENGLMILVCKNFIRQKKVVRLDLDTISLCEQAGFTYQDRYYRKLPAQSFWRTIYYKKHPEVERLDYEDVLVLKK